MVHCSFSKHKSCWNTCTINHISKIHSIDVNWSAATRPASMMMRWYTATLATTRVAGTFFNHISTTRSSDFDWPAAARPASTCTAAQCGNPFDCWRKKMHNGTLQFLQSRGHVVGRLSITSQQTSHRCWSASCNICTMTPCSSAFISSTRCYSLWSSICHYWPISCEIGAQWHTAAPATAWSFCWEVINHTSITP